MYIMYIDGIIGEILQDVDLDIWSRNRFRYATTAHSMHSIRNGLALRGFVLWDQHVEYSSTVLSFEKL